MKNTLLLAGILLTVSPIATHARAADLEPARHRLGLLAGASFFRGGVPESAIGRALPFQPDVTSPTYGVSVSIRAVRKLRVEFEATRSNGREEEGFEGPDNHFLTAGLSYPLVTRRGGALTFALDAGGGMVERRVQDAFQKAVEDAFDIDSWDPAAYAGASIEWRFGRRLGLLTEYRLFRIFPEKQGSTLTERPSYHAHRALLGLSLSF